MTGKSKGHEKVGWVKKGDGREGGREGGGEGGKQSQLRSRSGLGSMSGKSSGYAESTPNGKIAHGKDRTHGHRVFDPRNLQNQCLVGDQKGDEVKQRWKQTCWKRCQVNMSATAIPPSPLPRAAPLSNFGRAIDFKLADARRSPSRIDLWHVVHAWCKTMQISFVLALATLHRPHPRSSPLPSAGTGAIIAASHLSPLRIP